MLRKSHILVLACAVGTVLAGAAYAQSPKPGPDALKVTMCGTSGPMAIPDRAKPCVAVEAGGNLYFVDMGPEAAENISAWRMPSAETKALFLTHFHSDHIGGIGEFNMQSWVAGRKQALPVIGPEGVEKVVDGFNLAYELDHSYRKAHHENDKHKYPLEAGKLKAVTAAVSPQTGTSVVLRDGDLTVTAIAIDHKPVVPALAFRFDYRGRSVVISGDTAYDPNLTAASKGADLIVHEAQNNQMVARLSALLRASGNDRGAATISDIVTYHTTPVDAVRVAKDAGAQMVVLTHNTLAGLPFYTEAAFLEGVELVDGLELLVAKDGHRITLPVGSEAIEVTGP